MVVFLRILMNHIQLLTLTAQFELEWPPILQSFFSAIKPVSEVTTQFLSIDCLLDKRNENKNRTSEHNKTEMANNSQDEFRIMFQKVLILALFPIAISIISYLVWTILYKISDCRR